MNGNELPEIFNMSALAPLNNMKKSKTTKLAMGFNGWLQDAATRWAKERSLSPFSVFVKVDDYSERNLLTGFVRLEFFDTKLAQEVSDWLKTFAPEWTVTFAVGFAEDSVVVSSSQILLPPRAKGTPLHVYLADQLELWKLTQLEMAHVPPEKWSRNRLELLARADELKKLT